MAQHGYLHDGYDNDDFGRGDDHEGGADRGSWRGDDGRNERDWRDDHRDTGGDRGRGFMFDERDYDRRHEHSAFSSPSPQDARDRFRLDDRHSDRDQWGGQQRSGGHFSASTHDHYRSWRDRQIEALDRDYEDYCREREQQFHQDFDSWRSNRQNQRGGQSRQQSESGQQRQSSEEVMDLDDPLIEGTVESQSSTASPMGAATMGTNNADNTASAPNATGRRTR